MRAKYVYKCFTILCTYFAFDAVCCYIRDVPSFHLLKMFSFVQASAMQRIPDVAYGFDATPHYDFFPLSMRQNGECDLNAGHDLVMEWDAKLIQSSFTRTVSHRAQSSANLCGALTIYRKIWVGRITAPYILVFIFSFFLFLSIDEDWRWERSWIEHFFSGCRRLKTHTPAIGRSFQHPSPESAVQGILPW